MSLRLRNRRRRTVRAKTGFLSSAVGAALAIAAAAAAAQNPGDLRASGQRIAEEVAAQRRAGTLTAAAQRAAVEKLGLLVLSFIDLSDRVASTMTEAREREGLRGAFGAVNPPLDGLYGENADALDRMTKKVIEDDGDLDALYESSAYRDAQRVASLALYYLNWMQYYGARLFDGPRRKELLERAARGFSEFAVDTGHGALAVESRLGRGLCQLELGNTGNAARDLDSVLEDTQASPERKAKARLALLDAAVRAGNVGQVLKISDQILSAGESGEANTVRFLRARALLGAAKKAGAAEAARYRKEAVTLLDLLRKAGGGWPEQAAALLAAGDPRDLDPGTSGVFANWEIAKTLLAKNDYKQAVPLLEAVANSAEAEARPVQSEARYFLGVARFQAGQYPEAAAALGQALGDDKLAQGAEAAYLRFKALEAVLAKDPRSPLAAEYESAVRLYLARFPNHKSSLEARFRLGELLQARGDYAAALPQFAEVKGDLGFALRAKFAALQCRFELLQRLEPGQPTPPPSAAATPNAAQRAALLADIGADLTNFEQEADSFAKHDTAPEVPLASMRSKAAVLKAVYLTMQVRPDPQAVVEALGRFDPHQPDVQDLVPVVCRMRLNSYLQLGRFTEARSEVEVNGGGLRDQLGIAEIETLAADFVRAGARNGGAAPQANRDAERVAVALYELAAAGSDPGPRSRATLARLYENTGETKKAARHYAELNREDATSLAALRGLARTSEAEHRLGDALGYWQQFLRITRPGDLPWYEGSYQVARLTHALGRSKEACAGLEQLKPAMPGLTDADLRDKLNDLYSQACR